MVAKSFRRPKATSCDNVRAAIACEPVSRPLLEVAVAYGLPRSPRQRQEEMYIVQGEEAEAEYLVRHEKVADVGPGESGAGGAVAIDVERLGIGPVFGALDVEAPVSG